MKKYKKLAEDIMWMVLGTIIIFFVGTMIMLGALIHKLVPRWGVKNDKRKEMHILL